MVKASIEVVKNVDGRVESGVVIVQGRKLRFNNVWDDEGILRTINFDGRTVPTMAELYWFMNEKFIERIRRIDLIDLISEITLIKTIETINDINTINTINDVTLVSQAKTDLWWIKGVQLINPTVAACVPISVENAALAYDAPNDRFKVDIKAVSVADLDIRNLTSASDSVEAKQATASNLNANVFAKHDNKTYKTAVFDATASGNLVAAVAAKVIKLHALTIQAQGTVAVNLNNGSGGTSLMEWSFQAREGAVIPMANAPAYWAVTGVNTALYVTLSAAVVVTITAIYSDDDAA